MTDKTKENPPARNSAVEPVVSRLYEAVEDYVRENNGKVIVVGGIQIQQFDDKKFNFYVAVKCTGELPDFVTHG